MGMTAVTGYEQAMERLFPPGQRDPVHVNRRAFQCCICNTRSDEIPTGTHPDDYTALAEAMGWQVLDAFEEERFALGNLRCPPCSTFDYRAVRRVSVPPTHRRA